MADGRERTETMDIAIRPMRPGEEIAASALVERVFREFVAADCSPEGVEEFTRYVQPEMLSLRLQMGCFVLLALAGQDESPPDGRIVGVIETRTFDHISLLFVDDRFHRQGIARALLTHALSICQRERPEVARIDVNSSLYAVGAYERMGFRQSAPFQERNGIRFVPMALEVAGPHSAQADTE